MRVAKVTQLTALVSFALGAFFISPLSRGFSEEAQERYAELGTSGWAVDPV